MTGRSLRCASIILAVLACTSLFVDEAKATVIDFEGIPDSTLVATQYPGLTFSNAIILTAGISLNEFDFPPYSGLNVASDDGGPISISFASPVHSVGAYFTYAEPVKIDAYDSSSTLIAQATSLFSTNDALLGDPGSTPNESISVSTGSNDIYTITITGDPSGSSFVMDNLTFGSSIPEPRPILLLFPALLMLIISRRGTVL